MADETQPLPDNSTNDFLADIPAQIEQREPEEVLLEWVGPNRVFKVRNREYYTTIAVIVVLLSILAFFANQIYLIPLIASFAFVSYVLAAVPPTSMHHQITTYGIRLGKKLYSWDKLGRYWFSERFGQILLHAEYNDRIFRRITVVLQPETEEDVDTAVGKYLLAEQPEPTFVEKAGKWLQEKFPLEHS